MKTQLCVYFDYTCPYCYQGMMDLLSLLPDYPQLAVMWIPCEAHPLPESAWVHSSLASQMMLAADADGADLLQLHRAVFEACFVKRQRIDDKQLLVDLAASCGADRDKVALALHEKKYEKQVLEHNVLVWETMHLEAVPCYQSGQKRLASHEDVMLPKKQLKLFLDTLESE